MKCIKSKCKYYQPDIFKSSMFRCILEDAPFKVESDVRCVIEKTIVKTVDRLNKLREYKKEIERLDGETVEIPSLVGMDDYAKARCKRKE